jgi:nitrogen regulatory protein PII
MQMIEAVIKPHKLDAVKTALAKMGILGVTAVECKGFGRQMGHTERYRGAKMDVGFVPKVLLKICVKSAEADKAVNLIAEAARTGEVGDGKIFVVPLERAVRIRTGEKDHGAVTPVGA